MDTELYLDTARLGRMCAGARGAEHDFLTLVSQLGSSLYCERFLSHGFESLPRRYQRRWRRLKCWSGIAGLQRQLGQVIHQPTGCPLYFFGHSDGLIRFAAESLCCRARMILTTDLEWPPYLQVLRQVASQHGCQVVTLRLHDCVMRDRAPSTKVVERILASYEQHDCDGLFLSDITYLGITVPISTICQSLPDRDRSFIVIDGAQAFGQRPLNLRELNCDLYLTGTQKWMQAYHPLRMAIGGREASAETLIATQHSVAHSARQVDPLHRFCVGMLKGEHESYGETINLIALVTTAGALDYRRMGCGCISNRWHTHLRNVTALRSETDLNIVGHKSLQSGIALVATHWTEEQNATRMRLHLHQHGLVASVFPRGLVRLALPHFQLPERFLHQIEQVVWSASQPTPKPNEMPSNASIS